MGALVLRCTFLGFSLSSFLAEPSHGSPPCRPQWLSRGRQGPYRLRRRRHQHEGQLRLVSSPLPVACTPRTPLPHPSSSDFLPPLLADAQLVEGQGLHGSDLSAEESTAMPHPGALTGHAPAGDAAVVAGDFWRISGRLSALSAGRTPRSAGLAAPALSPVAAAAGRAVITPHRVTRKKGTGSS